MKGVLEDWIYLYYLNTKLMGMKDIKFLRIEFICIIWTVRFFLISGLGSWGLNLFVLFERRRTLGTRIRSSWGLNLFVLFEHTKREIEKKVRSWGLNLFVLFELWQQMEVSLRVLEDWIYLYYLNSAYVKMTQTLVLEDWIYLYYLILFIWCYINYHILTYTLFSYRKTPTTKAWANDFCVMFIRFFP